jgi:predicted transcriptional regulator
MSEEEKIIEEAKHKYRQLLIWRAKAAKIKDPTPEQMEVIEEIERLIQKVDAMIPEIIKDIEWEDLAELDSMWEDGYLETKFIDGKEYVRLTEKGKAFVEKMGLEKK